MAGANEEAIDDRVMAMGGDEVSVLAAMARMGDGLGGPDLRGYSDAELASSLLRLQDAGMLTLDADDARETVGVTLHGPAPAARSASKSKLRRTPRRL